MSLGGLSGCSRRWIVRRADYLASVTAAGLTLRIAETAAPCDASGRPDPRGRCVMIQSDADPRRHRWGLLGFPPLPDAWELDRRPDAGLFDVKEPGLFSEV